MSEQSNFLNHVKVNSNQTIGNKIKRARIAKELTLEELARIVDCSTSTISRIENGEFKKIPVSIIDRIARALGTTKDALAISIANHDLPDYLIEFICNPDSLPYLKSAYFKYMDKRTTREIKGVI